MVGPAMLAVRYHEFGGRDVLRVEDVDPLAPAVDEVLVDVKAVGVNPCDALRRQGL
jgi:NADPH:quinone reductase-like Zn-dependent oxidoreductase